MAGYQRAIVSDAGMIAHPPAESSSRFLRTFFRSLDDHQIRYCVLHSWENLPDELTSDLDLAVHPGDSANLRYVFRDLIESGYEPIQCLNYFAKAYYFVFVWHDGRSTQSAAVDIIFEHRRSGLILATGEELVADRQRWKDLWVSDPKTEFAYLLAKKTWKGSAPPRSAKRMKALLQQIGHQEAEKISAKIFSGKLSGEVVESCGNGGLDELLREIRRRPWHKSVSRHPLGLARFVFGEAARLLRRVLQPTGFFVVILGPDGVGKSTIVGQLIQALTPCFRRHRIFHWRPMVIPARGEAIGPVTNPHDQPPRSVLGSVAGLLVKFIDYWLGYFLLIQPLLARSGLVIFDRYFQDILIDPIRYRYGGPMWVPRFLSHVVPPPDLVFLVLDAEDEVILSRKKELPLEELQRQRARYQEFANVSGCGFLIKADDSIEKTVDEASRVLVEYLSQRFRRRYHAWLDIPNDMNHPYIAKADSP